MSKTKKKTKTKEKELTLAEKEAIIAQKVKDFKWPKGKMFFYIQGGGATRTLRDFWESNLVEHVIKTGTEGFGMTQQTVLDICTGKMMVIGDSRIESYPGGLEGVDDDGRFGTNQTSIEQMVEKLEKTFVVDIAIANAARRDRDNLLPLPTKKGYEARGPFSYRSGEGVVGSGADELNNIIEHRTDAGKKAMNGLEILYPLVGKKMSDLPIDKIATYLSKMENATIAAEWEKFYEEQELDTYEDEEISEDKKDAVFEKIMEMNNEAILHEIETGEEKPLPDYKGLFLECAEAYHEPERMKEWFGKLEEEEVNEIIDALEGKKYEEVHKKIELMNRWPITPPESVGDVGSAWILPDGRVFGGHAYAWIHNHIIENLNETGFFGSDTYGSEERAEAAGWVKLSGGHGFMLYEHVCMGNIITQEQIDVIIDWTIQNEMKRVEWNGHYITLKTFANATPEEIMDTWGLERKDRKEKEEKEAKEAKEKK